MSSNTFSVSVLLHRDGNAWFAQCLEYNVAAQGDNPQDATERFLYTLGAQIMADLKAGRQLLEGLGSAPVRYSRKLMHLKEGPELPVFVQVERGPRPTARARFYTAVEQVGAEA